jgi:hypothetical protein
MYIFWGEGGGREGGRGLVRNKNIYSSKEVKFAPNNASKMFIRKP